jgi:mono/diheme cytochrome c family protein
MTHKYASRTALIVALVCGVGVAPSAFSQVTRGDVAAGQKLAQQWCSGCHSVDPKSSETNDRAPSFLSIAKMPSTTSTSLQAWLQSPHPRMPNWQLTR